MEIVNNKVYYDNYYTERDVFKYNTGRKSEDQDKEGHWRAQEKWWRRMVRWNHTVQWYSCILWPHLTWMSSQCQADYKYPSYPHHKYFITYWRDRSHCLFLYKLLVVSLLTLGSLCRDLGSLVCVSDVSIDYKLPPRISLAGSRSYTALPRTTRTHPCTNTIACVNKHPQDTWLLLHGWNQNQIP